ncbi:MAG: hypothetical protein J6C97_05490, partial [Clostridia bacterium]|nr:hypothetical protein [Clostridia bacterium]
EVEEGETLDLTNYFPQENDYSLSANNGVTINGFKVTGSGVGTAVVEVTSAKYGLVASVEIFVKAKPVSSSSSSQAPSSSSITPSSSSEQVSSSSQEISSNSQNISSSSDSQVPQSSQNPPANSGGCGGSISASGITFILALLAIGFIVYKKRKA